MCLPAIQNNISLYVKCIDNLEFENKYTPFTPYLWFYQEFQCFSEERIIRIYCRLFFDDRYLCLYVHDEIHFKQLDEIKMKMLNRASIISDDFGQREKYEDNFGTNYMKVYTKKETHFK